MSGTGANLPVRIEVEGTAQAEQQFNRVGQAGQQAMQRVQQSTQQAGESTNRFSNIVGQAGFQIGDFASQVQAGGSAMTALSQQGSQFLGAFGTGGAVAGAVLTVGVLAATFFDLASKIETTTEAEERLREAVAASAEVYETAEDRANRLAQARIRAAAVGIEDRITAEREALRALNAQIRDIDERRRFAQQQLEGRGVGANPQAAGVFRAESERLAREAEQISARLAELDLERTRLLAIGSGQTFGPPAPPPKREPAEGRGAAPRTDLSEVNANLATYRQLQADIGQIIRQNETPYETYQRRLEEIGRLVAAARANGMSIPDETIGRAAAAAQAQLDSAEAGADRVSGAANQLGFSFSSAFEDAIIEGEKLSEVLKGLEQDIARIIIRSAITQPLGNAIAGAVTGAVGSYFGNPGGAPKNLDGARASGGPVFAGNTYLVGEQGPELVTFGASASVTPNGALGGPSITQQFNIDARGADAGLLPRLRAEMAAVVQAGNAALMEQINRGGRAASIVGRR